MIKYAALIEKISAYDSIVIFRHANPDGDALGSQFGLKRWINDNYPDKQVYAAGEQTCTQGIWPSPDSCSDELIAKSLAIVLDTATRERADDQRFLKSAEIIKIDHHPETDPYGNINLVQDDAAAVCEILADFFQTSAMILSTQTAEYLYKGLLTDTLRFSTGNTTPATLAAAAYLSSANINIPAINRELFDLSLKEFRFASLIRSKVQCEAGFALVILTIQDQEAFDIYDSEARGHIDEIGHVTDFTVWAMFTERKTETGIVYDGSLRSKHAAVNSIAAVYGGGGHRNAAGVKNLSKETFKEICARLKEAAQNEN